MKHESMELLQRVLAGELAEDSPEAKRLFEAEPEARGRLQELREVEDSMQRALSERAAVLAAASEEAVPGEEEALAAFRKIAGLVDDGLVDDGLADATSASPSSTSEPPRALGPGRVIALIASAAALFLLTWTLAPTGSPAPEELHSFPLGTGDGLVAPLSGVDEYGTFAWDIEAPLGGTFTLRIWDATPEGAQGLVHEEEYLYEQEWTPSPDLNLPARIQWRVVVVGPTGAPGGEVAEGSAWLLAP